MFARKMSVAGRELVAYARQATLLYRDLGRPGRMPRAGDDLVVGLHGLFATGGVLRPLRMRLERRGVATAAMSYLAGPGIAVLAERLARWLDDWLHGAPARLHLVGHSLGGIVARYYALYSGDPRVVQTISLASPFAGLPALRGLSLPLLRDLAPDSALLREIRLGRGVPHLSLLASDDHLVGAPASHALPGGDVWIIEGCGHNGLLFDERAAERVTRRVLAACSNLIEQ